MGHIERIAAIAERFGDRWASAPPIHVVPTAGDLPFPAPADAEGAFRGGETFLVAGALDQKRAVEVIAHEVIGHHGLRRTLGGTWRSFLASTLDGARRDPELRATRQQIEEIYAADGGTVALPPMRLADEIAATIAERSVNPRTGEMAVARPLQKQAAALAGHVAREVLLMDRPVCVDQLQGTVLLAERQLRVGGTFLGWRGRIARWYAGFMAYKFDPNARPMSWQESKDLLRAEETRLQNKEENGIVLQVLALAVIVVFFVGYVMWTGIKTFGWLH